MSKTAASTGTPAPATANPQIEKALLQIEEMTKALKARQEAMDKREKELEEKAAKLNANRALNPTEAAKVVESHKTKAEKMRDQLHAQPKVTIMIPLEPGEKEGASMPVTLNGYRYTIMKNVYVEVPKQVADVVMNALKQTAAAGMAFRTDIARPAKGGITVEEALL